MKDKEVKIESSMGERFDKKFTYISSGFLGNEDYISLIEVKINDLKSFIQSEIDLAVAKREKEIVGILEESKDGSDGDVVLDYIINIITAK